MSRVTDTPSKAGSVSSSRAHAADIRPIMKLLHGNAGDASAMRPVRETGRLFRHVRGHLAKRVSAPGRR